MKVGLMAEQSEIGNDEPWNDEPWNQDCRQTIANQQLTQTGRK